MLFSFINMDIIKDNPFRDEKRIWSKAEAWTYLKLYPNFKINKTAEKFQWSTTKLYRFLELTGIEQVKNTPKKTSKKTPQNAINTSKANTSTGLSEIKKTPKKTDKKTLEERKKEFYNKLIPYVEKYGKEMIRDFFNYWSEHNEDGKLMTFEKTRTKTFSLPNRLATWKRNEEKYGSFKTKRDVRLEESAKRKQELAKLALAETNRRNEEPVF